MSDGPDPVSRWLDADVELLQAPSGSFDRIWRRARRRKAMRTAAAAAGAVLVIAAVAVTPQLISAAGTGHGPAAISSPTFTGRTSHSPSATSGRNGGTSGVAGPALSSGDSGHAPAPGFRPTSVTFVGPDTGAVLGQALGHCPGGSCTSVAGTTSYGRSWFGIGAPDAGSPHSASGASQIRFLDQANGWAFGPALYATHDGGAAWTRVTGLPAGSVIDLATVNDRVFAVLATCTGSGTSYATGCTSFAIISAPARGTANRWTLVPGASAHLPVRPGGLQLTTNRAYLLAAGEILAGPLNGGAWHRVRPSAASAPPCLTAGASGTTGQGATGSGQPAAFLAPTVNEVFTYCARALPGRSGAAGLYGSADGGTTWTLLGPAVESGAPTSLAVAPDGALVLATADGLYYSTTATGRLSWHRGSLAKPAPPGGFTFVGMTTDSQGVAVPADAAAQEIFTTTDGGVTWQARPIR